MKRSISVLSSVAVTAAFLVPALAFAAGPAPVDLLSAGNFAILSKTGITNTGSHTTVITGNIGSSPITAAAMNNVFCSEIIGTIYGVNAAYTGSGATTCFAGNPPLSNKTLVDNAVLDMGTAYADAAGRTLPTATGLGAGNIGGMTLAPGLYKWSTGVTIPSNVTLSGGANDVWIFQIAGNLSIASGGSVPAGIKVLLSGGAKASNVFWQVGGATGATLGTYSTFNGNILSAKQVIIQTGAVLNGRALARTQVTLDANIVSSPVSTITKNNTTISTALSTTTSVLAGSTVHDSATLSNATTNARGTVAYTVYSNNTCTTGAKNAGVKTVINALVPNSNTISFNTLGTYYWQAVYSGDAQNAAVTSSCGSEILTVSAVTTPPTGLGTIHGIVFNDLNKNDIKDVSDPALSGWMVSLHKGSKTYDSPITATATTDANGNYSFGGLAAGTYFVEEQAQTGWNQTSGDSFVTLNITHASAEVDFSNVMRRKW